MDAPDGIEVLRRTPAWTVPCVAEGDGGCKTVRTIYRKPVLSDLICDRHKSLGHQTPAPWPEDSKATESPSPPQEIDR